MMNPMITWRPSTVLRLVAITMLASTATLSLGCAPESDEEVGVAQQAAMNPNAMNPNAMNPNAMNPNAMNPNAMNPNALDPSAMDPGAMSAIQDPGDAGELSREFLRYAVGCALRPDQSFAFTWTDSLGNPHPESYPGLLGLAPSWATQALDASGQQWVSDCLASRVNAKGVSVMLSSRGTHPALTTTSQELATYQTREAVFFGNVFTGTPKVYACYDPLSLLPSQLQSRVCAQPPLINLLTGGYTCGAIEVLGPCTHLLGLGFCANENHSSRYLYDCAPSGGVPIVPSITTFLQGSIPW